MLRWLLAHLDTLLSLIGFGGWIVWVIGFVHTRSTLGNVGGIPSSLFGALRRRAVDRDLRT